MYNNIYNIKWGEDGVGYEAETLSLVPTSR